MTDAQMTQMQLSNERAARRETRDVPRVSRESVVIQENGLIVRQRLYVGDAHLGARGE